MHTVSIRWLIALITPVLLAAASAASAYTLSSPPPPSWFGEGKALIEARGGKCVSETVQAHGYDLIRGEVTWPEYSVRCSRSLPRAVSPAAELCFANATEGRLFGDSYGALCRIYANPGTEASPNRATWRCDRERAVYDKEPQDNRDEARWTTTPSAAFPEDRQSLSLADCIAPRVALGNVTQSLADARASGLKLRVICSHDCKTEVGALRVKLKAGKSRVFRLRLPRGAARATATIEASAGSYRRRTKITARIRAGRVRVTPDPLELVKR